MNQREIPIPNLSALKLIDNYDAFTRLKSKMRNKITLRLDWIIKIQSAKRGEKCKVIAKAAELLKVSIPTVNRFVRSYESAGWQALCDQRGKNVKALPEAFKDDIRRAYLQCQRATSGREVQRMKIEQWSLWRRTGDPKYKVPGYDTPPPAGPLGYPVGWSVDNLARFRPDEYALAIARQGAKSAAKFLLPILKTRGGTKVGSIVMADDQWLDIVCAAPGASQSAVRPLCFTFLDFHSGCVQSHNVRFRVRDKEAGKNRELTNQDFVWACINYFQRHGYLEDPQGTVLVCEWGSASGFNNKELSTFGGFSNFDDALLAVSHGCIKVMRSGLYNTPAFADLWFSPASSGNPNFKSPVESIFNYWRNRMSALPGPTGRNRDEKPAEAHGRDIYTAQLLKLWERLDQRHRTAILWPILTAAEFANVDEAIYRAINSRTDHRLEGWEGLGYLAPQFRWDTDERSPWMTREQVADLPSDTRAALLAKAEIPGHVRTHRLSPAEVAARGASELTQLPDSVIPLLVPRQWARVVTVKSDRTIQLSDQLLGSEPMHYVCRIKDDQGSRLLNPGTKLLAYLNPFRTERLCVCAEDGSYIGTLQQRDRAGWLDQDAILEQLKERAEIKADLDTGVKPLLQGLMDARTAMKANNARLKAGKPVLPEEIAAARVAAAQQGQRTAAANRLNEHGDDREWQTVDAASGEDETWQDPFASLPEGEDFPDSI